MFSSNPRILASLQAVSRALAASVAGLGVLVLSGWFFDVMILKAGFPGLVTMKVNTAVCFVLLGLAASWPANRKVSATMIFVAVLIAGASLYEYASGLDLGIDQLLFLDPGDAATTNPGRMGPVTAVCFLLVGCGGLLPPEQPRWQNVNQGMLFVVVTLGISSLLGYLFAMSELGSVWGLTRMALHTGAGFILLAFSGLLARPDVGWMDVLTSTSIAGTLARRTLPLAIALPLLGNVMRALGERANLFDRSTGVFILVTVGTAVLMLGTVLGARVLRRLDSERHSLDVELIQQREVDSIRRNFLAAVSHELRSPAGAISMFVPLVENGLKGGPERTASALKYLARIRANADRLSDFINDLFSLSQFEKGTFRLTPCPLSIRDQAARILPAYRKLGEARDIRIDNDIPPDLPNVLADAACLSRALSHLISNALKFTPAGGTVRLDAAVDTKGAMARISVRDTGVGLGQDELDRLFRGFRQGVNVHTRQTGVQGVGLGLHLVKLIAEAHGGNVHADSSPGAGTTVSMTLPLAGEPG